MTKTSIVAEARSATNTSFAGYARQFEIRPEPIYTDIVRLMVDASVLRKRAVGELKIFYIPHMFSGANEVFLGFGKPNTYLVVNDGKEHPTERAGRPTYGYQKFAGKSLKRAPSVIEDTRLWVQSGLQVRLLGLPDHASAAIRDAMKAHDGIKYWTCVNACLRVLEDAGFRLGSGRRLSSIYLPYQLFSNLLRHGLYFGGERVEFEFIRTADAYLEEFMTDVIKAETLTFCRHADRAIDGKAESRSRVWKGIRWARNLPGRALSKVRKPKKVEDKPTPVVAPLLPDGVEYANDIRVRVSKPSSLGIILRLFWKPHTLFELTQDRVNVSDYLPGSLVPFPEKGVSEQKLPQRLLSRAKKRLLFSPLVVKYILRHLAPEWHDLGTFDERTVQRMLRTHTDATPNKYNIVVARNRVIIARVSVGSKIADWILSKHVLLANWDKDLPWAGETAKLEDGSLELEGNSGTYQPSDAEDDGVVGFVQAVFPHWSVRKKARQG